MGTVSAVWLLLQLDTSFREAVGEGTSLGTGGCWFVERNQLSSVKLALSTLLLMQRVSEAPAWRTKAVGDLRKLIVLHFSAELQIWNVAGT